MADLVPEDQFDVELIVQCIRSSENPRTHTQALLLLATSAKLFPVNLLKVFHIFADADHLCCFGGDQKTA